MAAPVKARGVGVQAFACCAVAMVAAAQQGSEPPGATRTVAAPAAAVKRGWTVTASFSAPEAHQAAAADENFFYVINNTTVTAYDRANKERQWVSRGGNATHLNSGFVWQGRLYCAHSNYPRHPNTSQIKVVDLASGEMADYKDFGVTNGSLTWAIRHDNSWWCNFAYYGDTQQMTRLVRFDDDWQEVGSWTYPEQLFEFLGKHSLSGGIWDGDTLLVTDHDNPVLYRLRLPERGSVLQWIDRRAAPFTGQGFAIDPVGVAKGATDVGEPAASTLSLVGIHRAKRLVILAAPAGHVP